MATSLTKILVSLTSIYFGIFIPVSISFSTQQCWGSVANLDTIHFSLDVKAESLRNVLKKVSELTGYQITVNEEWADLPVTATLANTNIDKCLKRILRQTDHTVVINENEKAISIDIYNSQAPLKRPKYTTDSPEKTIDQYSVEVIPPEVPGERGITQSELNSMLAIQGTVDPLDVEVVPPQIPGERGITQRELNAILASEKKVDPADLEVISSPVPGERGITQKELNSILAQENKVDPLDVEVIPPSVPGEKGITQRELNAILASGNKVDPEDLEVIPPEIPGERGVTLRELKSIKGW